MPVSKIFEKLNTQIIFTSKIYYSEKFSYKLKKKQDFRREKRFY